MTIKEEMRAGKPISVPVIDTHTHLLVHRGGSYWSPDASLPKTLEWMDRIGVNCTCGTANGYNFKPIYQANEDMQAVMDFAPGRFYGLIYIAPEEGLEAAKRCLEHFSKDERFVGIKLLSDYHGSLLQEEYLYALDFALEANCPIMFHNWGTRLIPEVPKIMEKRPELKLISAHLGGGRAPLTLDYWEIMKDYPYMKMDVCGSVANSLTMEDLIALTGPERWILGTDMSCHDPSYDIGKVALSTLDDRSKAMILAGNYLALLEGSQLGRIRL